MPEPGILLIEDDPKIRRFLRTAFVNHGYRLFEAATGQPEAMACGVVDGVLACAYATDSSGNNGVAQLEPMATQLLGSIAEAL